MVVVKFSGGTIVPIVNSEITTGNHHRDEAMDFGVSVRERRKALHLSQLELAELAQVSERFVREVENNKPSLRLDKLQAVLAVLGYELAIIDYVPPALRRPQL